MGLLRYQTGFDCMPLWYLEQARGFSWGKAGASRLREWKIVIWFLPCSDLPCDMECDIVNCSWECGGCTSFHFNFWEILDKSVFSVPGFLLTCWGEVSLTSKVRIHIEPADHCSRFAAHSSADPSLNLWCLLHRSPETGILPVWQEPSWGNNMHYQILT